MAGKLALLLLGWGVAGAQPRAISARAGTLGLLHADWGRVELRLGPGAALTMTEGSTLRMQENRLSDVRVELEEGSALVSVGLALSPFKLNDSDPLIAWELQLAGDRRPAVRLALPTPWR
jgi:hypothetical protein